MTSTTFAHTTALTLCLALTVPGPSVAQSNDACPDGSAPPCAEAATPDRLERVIALLQAGETPTAAEIDALDKGALKKLISNRDLDIDPKGKKPDALRDAVKAALEIETDARAATGADDGGGLLGDLEQAAEDTVDDLERALGADGTTEGDAEARATTSAEGNATVSSRDIDMMNKGALIQLVRERNLDIDTRGMKTEALRTAVRAELGMETRAETEPGAGDTLEDSADAVADELEQALGAEEPEASAGEDGNLKKVEDRAREGTPMAAKEDPDTEAQAEVTTQTVTEETARSSDEAFETSVLGDAEATAEAETRDSGGGDGDDGMSDLAKAAAIGFGALALNEILDGDDEVVSNSGDRVVVRQDGQLRVLKDDDVHLRQPGNEVQTRTYADGSSRTVVTRPDGSRVITIRGADGRVQRRVRERPDGSRILLFDDTQDRHEPVEVSELPEPRSETRYSARDRAALEAALEAELAADVDRRFSLRQVREIEGVRNLMPEVTVDAVNFRTDSAVIRPREAEDLADLGREMAAFIDRNPDEIFLVEGHTDTVGGAAYNLALSDRRAESVALALTEYFDVPPENLIIQGYGESDLAVPVEGPERANRRATVRRITPLLR